MNGALVKDPALLDMLDRMRSRLGPDAFDIVDHWDSDLTAVGVANPSNHRVLAYIAVYPNGYYVGLELPPAAGDDLPYTPAGAHSGLSFDQLADVVAEHLICTPTIISSESKS